MTGKPRGRASYMGKNFSRAHSTSPIYRVQCPSVNGPTVSDVESSACDKKKQPLEERRYKWRCGGLLGGPCSGKTGTGWGEGFQCIGPNTPPQVMHPPKSPNEDRSRLNEGFFGAPVCRTLVGGEYGWE